jgi:hypothetical protein
MGFSIRWANAADRARSLGQHHGLPRQGGVSQRLRGAGDLGGSLGCRGLGRRLGAAGGGRLLRAGHGLGGGVAARHWLRGSLGGQLLDERLERRAER